MASVYARCGKIFNVDPLSEKYAYQSHYNFSENILIDGREIEGLEYESINDDGDFMDYGEAMEFARNTGGYVTFDGEFPQVIHDIEEVVLQGSNRGTRENSDHDDALAGTDDFDPYSYENMGPEPGARGMVSLDLLSVPYMIVQAAGTQLLQYTGVDGDEAWDDVGMAMLLSTFKPNAAAGEVGALESSSSQLTSRAARRAAMREEGIPTSQQPSKMSCLLSFIFREKIDYK